MTEDNKDATLIDAEEVVGNVGEAEEAPQAHRPPGRPSTFDPSYIRMAEDYFSRLHKDEESGAIQVPSRVFFARSIGEYSSTVRNWEEKYPEFGRVIAVGIEHAKELRIMLAENKMLDGSFSKFVLASAYGMTEKSAVEVSGEGGKPFEVNIRIVEDAKLELGGGDGH